MFESERGLKHFGLKHLNTGENMPFYILGVIDSGGWIEFGPIGFADPYGEKAYVKTIPYGSISMVVCEMDEWKVNEGNKVDLLNKLLEHQKILEEIMQKQFILPAKFGTTLDNEHDVIAVLSQYFSQLKSGIAEMKDFVEIDVVVTWDTTVEVKKIAATDDEIKKMKAKAEKIPEGERGQKVIEVGMRLEEKLEERRKEIEKVIFDTLKTTRMDRVDHDRLEDRMVVNSSFLLKKSDEANFFGVMDKLDQKLDGTLRFKCISPLPPHSFKTIVINKVNALELKEAMDLFDVTAKTTIEQLNGKNRQLIKKMHPDKTRKAGAEAEFDKLNKSYKLLSSMFRFGGSLFSNAENKNRYVLEFQGGER